MSAPPKQIKNPSWLLLLFLLILLTGCLLRPYRPTTEFRAELKGTVFHLDPSNLEILEHWDGHSPTGVVSLVIPYVDELIVSRHDQDLQLRGGMPIDAGVHKLKVFVSFEKFKAAVNGGVFGDFYFKFDAGKTYRLEPPRYEKGDDQTIYIRLYQETAVGEKAVDMFPVEYKFLRAR
jgi:hypothetical protein